MSKKIEDLSGQTFGKWQVIALAPKTNFNIRYYCRCACGTEREFTDLTGEKFNNWFVISLESNRSGTNYYHCKCDCGNSGIVRSTDLKKNRSKSCGCLSKYSHNPSLASANHRFITHYKDGDLSFEEFLTLSQEPCYYCGIKRANRTNRYEWAGSKRREGFNIETATFLYNGLDRIDSKMPHNKNNVVSCCPACNTAKMEMSLDEFKQWVDRVYNFCVKPLKLTNNQI